MGKAKGTETMKDIPGESKIIEDPNMANVVNGVIDVLKDNHINRDQAKLIFHIVDIVLQEDGDLTPRKEEQQ